MGSSEERVRAARCGGTGRELLTEEGVDVNRQRLLTADMLFCHKIVARVYTRPL
jgi:hypothetical protein